MLINRIPWFIFLWRDIRFLLIELTICPISWPESQPLYHSWIFCVVDSWITSLRNDWSSVSICSAFILLARPPSPYHSVVGRSRCLNCSFIAISWQRLWRFENTAKVRLSWWVVKGQTFPTFKRSSALFGSRFGLMTLNSSRSSSVIKAPAFSHIFKNGYAYYCLVE